MKVGSIVECVNNKNPNQGRWDGCEIPKLNHPYTVRNITKCPNSGGITVRLEEIINPINKDTGSEFGYKIERFRELLPPMEIQSALDECETVLIKL